MSSTTSETYSNKHGTCPKLTFSNFHIWKPAFDRLARANGYLGIFQGTEEKPTPPEPPLRPTDRELDELKDYNKRVDGAANMAFGAADIQVQVNLDGLTNPEEMYNALIAATDITASEEGRQQVLEQFWSLEPKAGRPIVEFFTALRELQNRLRSSTVAINDGLLRSKMFKSLPPAFDVIKAVWKSRTDVPISQIMETLQLEESNWAIQNRAPAGGNTYNTQKTGQYLQQNQSQANQQQGPNGNGGGPFWCNYHKRLGHSTEKCWAVMRKKATEGNNNNRNGGGGGRYHPYSRPQGNQRGSSNYGNNYGSNNNNGGGYRGGNSGNANFGNASDDLCFHCGDSGHVRRNCPDFKIVQEKFERARNGGQAHYSQNNYSGNGGNQPPAAGNSQ